MADITTHTEFVRLLGGCISANVSILLVAAGWVWLKERQFFPWIAKLSRSKYVETLGTSLCMLLIIAGVDLVRWLVFGDLDRLEREEATERLYPSIMEALVAFRMFEGPWSTRFMIRATLLFAYQYFHWIAIMRVDKWENVNTLGGRSRKELIKMWLLLGSFLVIDTSLAWTHLRKEMGNSYGSSDAVYAYEFYKMAVGTLATSVKFLFSTTGIAWLTKDPSRKGFYLLIVSFVHELLLVAANTALAGYVTTLTKKVPIFAIRPTYMRLKKLYGLFMSVLDAHKAFDTIQKLPNSTEDQISRHDKICAVCRDEMTPVSDENSSPTTVDPVKHLGCGHNIHLSCLKSWMERQQKCPICRESILQPTRPFWNTFLGRGYVLGQANNDNNEEEPPEEEAQEANDENAPPPPNGVPNGGIPNEVPNAPVAVEG